MMEEAIFKILKSHTHGISNKLGLSLGCVTEQDYNDISKEVSSMITEFIKWKEFWVDYDNADETYFNDKTDTWMNLEQVFDYWIKNIKT